MSPGPDKEPGHYVTVRTALGGAVTLLLVIMGWLFSTIVYHTKEIDRIQKSNVQRLAFVEARVEILQDQVRKLIETRTLKKTK